MLENGKGSRDLSEPTQTLSTSTLKEMVHCPRDWNEEDTLFTDRAGSGDKVNAFKIVNSLGRVGRDVFRDVFQSYPFLYDG